MIPYPTMRMGPDATAMERKAARNQPGRELVTDLGQRSEKIREHNQLLDAAKHAWRVLRLARKIGKRSAEILENKKDCRNE